MKLFLDRMRKVQDKEEKPFATTMKPNDAHKTPSHEKDLDENTQCESPSEQTNEIMDLGCPLSKKVKEYLASIQITTAEQLMATPTMEMCKGFKEWEANGYKHLYPFSEPINMRSIELDVEDADKEEITNLDKKRVLLLLVLDSSSSHLSIDDTNVRTKRQRSNSENWVTEKTHPMSRECPCHDLAAAFGFPPKMGRLVAGRSEVGRISNIEDQVGADTDRTEDTTDDDNGSVDEGKKAILSHQCDVTKDNTATATTTTTSAAATEDYDNVDEGEQIVPSHQCDYADRNAYDDNDDGSVDEDEESIPGSCQCNDDESIPCSLGHCNMLWPKKLQSLIQHENIPPCNYFPIGFEWDDGNDYDQWLGMYDQLRFSKPQDTDSKKVANNNSKDNLGLRNWMSGQRILYKNESLSNNRIYLLECIEFDWKRPANEEQTEWMQMFERLVRCKKRHSCVPSNNCYNEDPKLRTWMYTQRCSCKKQYRINLLNQIDFEWKIFI